MTNTLPRPPCKDQSERRHRSKKKRRHRSSSSSSSRSTSSNSHIIRIRNFKDLKIPIKRSSSSISSTQSENDYGRYKMVKLAPQIAETPTLQPAEHVNITPNLPEIPKNRRKMYYKGPKIRADSEAEIWSFDRAINKVFLRLPPELFLKTTQEKEKTPIKPLSGIKHLMESHATPFLILPQSKLVENTAKFIQDKLNMDKCCKDWICPQNLVTFLAPTKFYKSEPIPSVRQCSNSRGRCFLVRLV